MENKICAIYARVSTLDQNPENQLCDLRRYAIFREYSIFNEYVDLISGSKDTRPALNDLLIDMRQGLFDAVLIYKLDRLGRSLQHLIQVVGEMKKLNIDLITSTQGVIDTTSPTGKMIFQFFGAIAEYERELIRERTLLSIDRRRREIEENGFYISSKGVKRTTLGRLPGSTDKKQRRKSGYYQYWSNNQKVRKKRENKGPPKK